MRLSCTRYEVLLVMTHIIVLRVMNVMSFDSYVPASKSPKHWQYVLDCMASRKETHYVQNVKILILSTKISTLKKINSKESLRMGCVRTPCRNSAVRYSDSTFTNSSQSYFDRRDLQCFNSVQLKIIMFTANTVFTASRVINRVFL